MTFYGKLYCTFDDKPGPEPTATFIELEDEQGFSHGPDVDVHWTGPEFGRYSLGPFASYATYQEAINLLRDCAEAMDPKQDGFAEPVLTREAVLEFLRKCRPYHARA